MFQFIVWFVVGVPCNLFQLYKLHVRTKYLRYEDSDMDVPLQGEFV